MAPWHSKAAHLHWTLLTHYGKTSFFACLLLLSIRGFLCWISEFHSESLHFGLARNFRLSNSHLWKVDGLVNKIWWQNIWLLMLTHDKDFIVQRYSFPTSVNDDWDKAGTKISVESRYLFPPVTRSTCRHLYLFILFYFILISAWLIRNIMSTTLNFR